MSRSLHSASPSFFVNSKYRDNQDEHINNFHYTIDIDNNKNYNCCALTSLRLPKSWYTVEATHNNNTFVLSEGGVPTTITIPAGNYNINSMKLTIENLLNTNSPNSWIYQVSYPDTYTQKQTFIYTFTVFKHTSQPSFIFSGSSRMTEILGFDTDTTYTFTSNTLTAPYTVQFELTNFITIKSSICNNTGNLNSDTSVLASIDVTHVRDGETIVYTMSSLDDATRLITNINQNVFSFSVYDDQDRPLELFDDWNMTIMVYEHDYSSSLQINDLKLKYLAPSEEQNYDQNELSKQYEKQNNNVNQ